MRRSSILTLHLKGGIHSDSTVDRFVLQGSPFSSDCSSGQILDQLILRPVDVSPVGCSSSYVGGNAALVRAAAAVAVSTAGGELVAAVAGVGPG
jgi:hypothetical protein